MTITKIVPTNKKVESKSTKNGKHFGNKSTSFSKQNFEKNKKIKVFAKTFLKRLTKRGGEKVKLNIQKNRKLVFAFFQKFCLRQN